MAIEISADIRPVVKDRRRILYNIIDPEVRGVFIGYGISKKQVLTVNFDPEKSPLQEWGPKPV